VIVDENDCSSVNIYAQVEGRITTRWSGSGMLRDLVVKLYYRVGRKGICRVSQPPEPRLPTTVIPDDQKPRSLAVGRPRGFERSQAISDNRGDPGLRRQPVVFEVAVEPESSLPATILRNAREPTVQHRVSPLGFWRSQAVSVYRGTNAFCDSLSCSMSPGARFQSLVFPEDATWKGNGGARGVKRGICGLVERDTFAFTS
jgi:hypothetical protein